jgi:hypothetical protein
LEGVNGEINMALLGHTDPSVHDKYGAKDKAIRFYTGSLKRSPV